MTPVRLEPAALRSRVKHSTTEPLRSLESEFKMVLNEMEKYSKLKQEIKESKNPEISEVEKNKLIEQGNKEAMNALQKSLKPT